MSTFSSCYTIKFLDFNGHQSGLSISMTVRKSENQSHQNLTECLWFRSENGSKSKCSKEESSTYKMQFTAKRYVKICRFYDILISMYSVTFFLHTVTFFFAHGQHFGTHTFTISACKRSTFWHAHGQQSFMHRSI